MSAMEVIRHIEVESGGIAEIDFDAIPQSYDELRVVCSIRYTTGANFLNINLRFNDSSASEYNQKMIYGTGSAATDFRTTSQSQISYLYGADSGATANVFSNGLIIMPNYTSSVAKAVLIESVTENNATAANQVMTSALWDNTSPITSIQLIGYSANNFVQYSSATLYGITAGSDGTTTVS